ncbi:MAG: aminotransferase class V-fold PLP-dependent enzyme [Planctomycetota bacterium]|nr:MAG: aminotransferase class V-fold PLP-dependent enzyme [Planctomycetota bacterium]REJ88433.1 MAG: aminotransferase class V-fold PLP-dependent enzyme [Planctomycetota bacterium]REK24856.1 MAG: aminotransferase class V-fold PLP-dependent enzyme [Planctomycetota bacterium]REK40135.1 MAG: aminotransferase class V-fold PLP-dependent enzyme [Planctomycetota bacterium]
MPDFDAELAEFDFDEFADAWSLADQVTYLNHGSFGPSPRRVIEARQHWIEELERQPMDFYVRRLEQLLDQAAQSLAEFVGCAANDLIFVPNSTSGMNIVERNVPLAAGDEVLLTDHEYGAVVRIWNQACLRSGAKVVTAELPRPLTTQDELVDALFESVTDRTRLIVVSHVSSQPAVILPIEEVCRRAHQRGIPVCVDGPHALAMIPFRLDEIGCDFYTASCHKWLSAPFGAGFLYVHPRRQQGLEPAVTSWGSSLSGQDASWKDEFHWPGTFDPTGYLAIAEAISFLEEVGLDRFRRQTHALARYARRRVSEATGGLPLTPDDPAWYASMVTISLPNVPRSDSWPGKPHPLQVALWDPHRIETPLFEWRETLCLRVSCHLYNRPQDVDLLIEALQELTA